MVQLLSLLSPDDTLSASPSLMDDKLALVPPEKLVVVVLFEEVSEAVVDKDWD
jgi:hypothetical protein